jgi:hypothetical protein
LCRCLRRQDPQKHRKRKNCQRNCFQSHTNCSDFEESAGLTRQKQPFNVCGPVTQCKSLRLQPPGVKQRTVAAVTIGR